MTEAQYQIAGRTAAEELLRRQRAQVSLAEFSQAVEVPGVPSVEFTDEETPLVYNPEGKIIGGGKLKDRIEHTPVRFKPIESRVTVHHLLMMTFIQSVMETPRGRGIIMAPPGVAKSTYASVVGPAWYMGKFPGSQLILASYASGIAAKQSRRVRQICREPDYGSIWPERPLLNADQRAIDDWCLSNGSGMMSAGILAGITGNRADGFVGDDLLANREQADSATIREKIYDEYSDTVLTRAKPKMWVLLIATRWHEDDLIGTILPENYEGESGLILCRDNQHWNVLCLQAECERDDDPLGREKGAFIWPEWYPEAHWRQWRDNPRMTRTWNALFQQRPAPQAGLHFNREMFKRYDTRIARTDVYERA